MSAGDADFNRRAYLNELLGKPAPTSNGKRGNPGKSGLEQISDNARQIRREASPKHNQISEHFGLGPCLISSNSLNGLGRPVKSIKWQLPTGSYQKRDFMAYHVTWVAEHGRIPDVNLSYSHWCHDACCVNPLHGGWESLPENSARNKCERNSHLVLPNGAIIVLCQHQPVCLSPRILENWNHPAILRGPTEATGSQS